MKTLPRWLFLTGCLFHFALCWDSEDYELFDLVEEVNTNFYTLLGVPEDANATEIRKAYRKLSLLLHPDKNDAPDAEIKFRQLVAVYDVLRDPGKRSRYGLVLQNGLPDWRHVAFYYRRVRKMGLAEMSLILFIIVTVGQYIVAWAAYFEKKYTLEQLWEVKLKKLQKKQKKGKYDGPALPDSIPVEIPSPRVWDTLPFQIPRFAWFLITMSPYTLVLLRKLWTEMRQKEDPEEWSEEEEEVVEVEPRGPRRRKGRFVHPEANSTEWEAPAANSHKPPPKDTERDSANDPPVVSGGLWTDDDLAELVRLVKKFPPGTVSRWEKIAQMMARPVPEVTHMAKKVKEDGYRVVRPENGDTAGDVAEEEKPRKVKTRGGKLGEVSPGGDASTWSQEQQKALEAALTKYPKGCAGERWEKIANCVPGKSKEECMLRYKQLVAIVKQKKDTTDTTSPAENNA